MLKMRCRHWTGFITSCGYDDVDSSISGAINNVHGDPIELFEIIVGRSAGVCAMPPNEASMRPITDRDLMARSSCTGGSGHTIHNLEKKEPKSDTATRMHHALEPAMDVTDTFCKCVAYFLTW